MIYLTDDQGLRLSTLDLPDVMAGELVQVGLKVVNTYTTARNVILLPAEADTGQLGSSMDTWGSLLLSVDGSNFTQSLTVTVPASGSKTVYVRFQPTITARLGECRFALEYYEV